MMSLPAAPSITLSPALPVSVSLKAEPIRFSTAVSVSLPADTVFWAVVVARLTVTAAVADA